jgi:hypothetical protein
MVAGGLELTDGETGFDEAATHNNATAPPNTANATMPATNRWLTP